MWGRKWVPWTQGAEIHSALSPALGGGCCHPLMEGNGSVKISTPDPGGRSGVGSSRCFQDLLFPPACEVQLSPAHSLCCSWVTVSMAAQQRITPSFPSVCSRISLCRWLINELDLVVDCYSFPTLTIHTVPFLLKSPAPQ